MEHASGSGYHRPMDKIPSADTSPDDQMEVDGLRQDHDAESSHSVAKPKKRVTAPPSKRACVFCRSRKSRCDGQQPCGTCRKRDATDSCHYTISRRGGRSKTKRKVEDEQHALAIASDSHSSTAFENHLSHLFDLSELPEVVRVEGAVPQLTDFQEGQQQLYTQSPDADDPAKMAQMAQTFNVHPFENTEATSMDVDAALASMGLSSMPGQPSVSPSNAPPNATNAQWEGMLESLVSWQGEAPSADVGLPAPGASVPPAMQPPPNTSNGSVQGFTDAFAQTPLPTWPAEESRDPQITPFPLATSSRERRAVLTEYYHSLYRFIPVTLPVTAPDHIGTLDRTLPPTSGSPFLLALHAILPLLRNRAEASLTEPNQARAKGRKELVRRQAAWYERRATKAIDAVLDHADEEENGPLGRRTSGTSASSKVAGDSTPKHERTLEVIQALTILTIFHYGSGRALKARTMADQALGLAMSLGMHKITSASSMGVSPSSSTAMSDSNGRSGSGSGSANDGDSHAHVEMRKRCWWVVWTLVLLSAYNTARNPTLRLDDPRVVCEMPLSEKNDSWSSHVLSLRALLYVQERSLALSHLTDVEEDINFRFDGEAEFAQVAKEPVPYKFNSLPDEATRIDVLRDMLRIDRSLQEQIAQLEERTKGRVQSHRNGPETLTAESGPLSDCIRIESDLEDYLHTSAAIQLYTASLSLHIPQAFQGASLFERKLCFLNTVGEGTDEQNNAACQVPMPDVTSFLDRLDTPSSPGDLEPVGGELTTASDLYACGPFLPRLSLQRCVHASKQLLRIGKGKEDRANEAFAAAGAETDQAPAPFIFASAAQDPNPFNACSYVLISFTLLMQALAIAGADPDDARPDLLEGLSPTDGELQGAMDLSTGLSQEHQQGRGQGGQQGQNNTHNLSRDLLDSARGATALHTLEQTPGGAGAGSNGVLKMSASSGASAQSKAALSLKNGARTSTPAHRLVRLSEIWKRVQEARDTLASLATSWDIVIPMADEVQLCLQTSQMLLTNDGRSRDGGR